MRMPLSKKKIVEAQLQDQLLDERPPGGLKTATEPIRIFECITFRHHSLHSHFCVSRHNLVSPIVCSKPFDFVSYLSWSYSIFTKILEKRMFFSKFSVSERES